ncbi:hypothetical protein D3C73_1175490 [compost metagenome]
MVRRHFKVYAQYGWYFVAVKIILFDNPVVKEIIIRKRCHVVGFAVIGRLTGSGKNIGNTGKFGFAGLFVKKLAGPFIQYGADRNGRGIGKRCSIGP